MTTHARQLLIDKGHISDGFVVYDSDGRLVTCNQKWKDIYAEAIYRWSNGQSSIASTRCRWRLMRFCVIFQLSGWE